MGQQPATFVAVAAWLWDEIRARGRLDEEAASALVLKTFGPRFVTRSKGQAVRVSRQVVYKLRGLADGQLDYYYSPRKCGLWVARRA
jgi:hypothetical protein